MTIAKASLADPTCAGEPLRSAQDAGRAVHTKNWVKFCSMTRLRWQKPSPKHAFSTLSLYLARWSDLNYRFNPACVGELTPTLLRVVLPVAFQRLARRAWIQVEAHPRCKVCQRNRFYEYGSWRGFELYTKILKWIIVTDFSGVQWIQIKALTCVTYLSVSM